MDNYNITLGITYYNGGFFNPGAVASLHLGNHGENLNLILPNELILPVIINRNINNNGSVRLYAGIAFTNFIQHNYILNDLMSFEILNPNTIRIIQNE